MAALRRWRWLILITGLLSVFTIEILEHESIADPHFWREIIIYGLAVPIIAWFVLTTLANQADRRGAVEAKSGWYQELNRNLEEHQDWTELTRFVVSFPATFLPVDHVSLFIYDHALAQLCLVTEWNAFGLIDSPLTRYRINASLCQSCFASRSSVVRPLGLCGFVSSAHSPLNVKEYCQPMFYDGLLVGIQLLRCKPGKDLTAEQQDQLQSSAASIALAMTLSIAHRSQVDQTRSQAESNERRRVAAELHDSLGQMISYLHLGLDRLTNDDRLQTFEDIRNDLARMLQVTDNAYDQVRSDLWVMHSWKTPNVKKAIVEYIELTARASGPDIQLRVEGEPVSLEPKVSYQVFTLVREGLNNLLTHARASNACVELVWTTDCLRIHLIDDGVGFDPARAFSPGHYGLQMMRERALALNGTLLIDSSPGRGTRLSFALPIGPPSTPPAAIRVADLQPLSQLNFTESPKSLFPAET